MVSVQGEEAIQVLPHTRDMATRPRKEAQRAYGLTGILVVLIETRTVGNPARTSKLSRVGVYIYEEAFLLVHGEHVGVPCAELRDKGVLHKTTIPAKLIGLIWQPLAMRTQPRTL